LEALDEDGNITEMGIEMSKFPLDPQYSKSLITSVFFDVEEIMLTLVSMLST
jgi:HrpA-like RNA helicase